MDEQRRNRLIITATVVLFVLAIVISIIVVISRIGKIGVSINTLPQDANVYVDGKPFGHTVFLKPGRYTFSAKKDGFNDGSSALTISDSVNAVYMTLEPVSDAAKKWANQEGIPALYETYSGNKANTEGLSMHNQNPLINKLPYVDVAGPFRIDFSYDDIYSRSKVYYEISNSTPGGRANAIKWIQSQNIDPATIDLRYDEFQSPLITGTGGQS